MKYRILALIIVTSFLLGSCGIVKMESNGDTIQEESISREEENNSDTENMIPNETNNSDEMSSRSDDYNTFTHDNFNLLPEDFSSLSNQSIIDYAVILLESGGKNLKREAGESFNKEDNMQHLFAAGEITKNYIESPFYGTSVEVLSIEELKNSEFYDQYTKLYTYVYRMEINILDSLSNSVPLGKQTWYLKTGIVSYEGGDLLIDWFMPENEFLDFKATQEFSEDISKIIDYQIGLIYGSGFSKVSFYNIEEIPKEHRGLYIVLNDPNPGFISSDKEYFDSTYYELFGEYYSESENTNILYSSETSYYTTDGGGYPDINNYINQRETDGNTVWYSLDFYPDEYYFRGFLQSPETTTKFGIRNNRIEAYIPNA